MKICLLLLSAALSGFVFATSELVEFSDPSYRARYQQLITELRCPKCQNQNLADSNSPISRDLRNEVQRLLEDGLSNQEIETYLTNRYSAFILYRPEVNKNTYLLWVSPLIILLVGGLVVARFSRQGVSATKSQEIAPDSDERLNDLLSDEEDG
ncbi:MAG: cytochrome c-type biogenesis protein CcmH [SAR92 clade bacterium]|uniref:Cytochrome c-type biogenesis protein n=1 Tax=SAR92 clade bacterium TaxID=2315479 RepID=A0A520MNR1_9GAMM|nr:MAG: cytochrome c-type biogenesis protein CcmH [SAR92 clade bacterium]